jgi:hypothetical protein
VGHGHCAGGTRQGPNVQKETKKLVVPFVLGSALSSAVNCVFEACGTRKIPCHNACGGMSCRPWCAEGPKTVARGRTVSARLLSCVKRQRPPRANIRCQSPRLVLDRPLPGRWRFLPARNAKAPGLDVSKALARRENSFAVDFSEFPKSKVSQVPDGAGRRAVCGNRASIAQRESKPRCRCTCG